VEVRIDTYCRRIRESLVASETSIKAALEPVKLIEGITTALPGEEAKHESRSH
jgi:hypothetical protein